MKNMTGSSILMLIGMLLGASITITISAYAQQATYHTLPIQEIRGFADVYAQIKRRYVDHVPDQQLIQDAISGMLSGLDPHSSFLNANEYTELKEGVNGEITGVGMEITYDKGQIRIVSPLEGGPADQAGIMAGDVILKINNTATKGMQLKEAAHHIRGQKGSSITVVILRKNHPEPLTFELMRSKLHIDSIRYKTIHPGYIWMRIANFQEDSLSSMIKCLYEELYDKDEVLKGLTLDLRNNPGGLLNSVINITSLFLPEKQLIVSTRGREPHADTQFFSNLNFIKEEIQNNRLPALPNDFFEKLQKIPIIVLVNPASASASEILAGALQDHQRALILGATTFGKGSVQTTVEIMSMRGNAIKLTTARYYTPAGRSIQARGITPDIFSITPYDKYIGFIRESELERHLPAEYYSSTENNNISIDDSHIDLSTPVVDSDKKDETEKIGESVFFTFGSDKDIALLQAIAILQENFSKNE